MLYAVKARYIPERLPEFYVRLRDGSIQRQKPDGEEICSAMQRARITEPGVVQWSEICFCPTPLAHERATVYDRFFTALSADPIEKTIDFAGEPFTNLLRCSAERERNCAA